VVEGNVRVDPPRPLDLGDGSRTVAGSAEIVE